MDTTLQEALCDKFWEHNPAGWGNIFFRPDGTTGWLNFSVELNTCLRADFSWRLISTETIETIENEPLQHTAAPSAAQGTTNAPIPKTETLVTSTRSFNIELTLLKDGPISTGKFGNPTKALRENGLKPRTLTVQLSEGRFPRQHPFLGMVQVYKQRLTFQPSLAPELRDWTDAYTLMAGGTKVCEWRSFYSGNLEYFEIPAPLVKEELTKPNLFTENKWHIRIDM